MASLKLAGKDDAEAVSILFKELHSASVYRNLMDYRPGDVSNLVSRIADDPSRGCTILLLEGRRLIGAIICSSMRQIFNQTEKTAVELGFWITPEFRNKANLKKLLSAYKYWAKKTGCNSILYGKLTDPGTPESYTVRKL